MFNKRWKGLLLTATAATTATATAPAPAAAAAAASATAAAAAAAAATTFALHAQPLESDLSVKPAMLLHRLLRGARKARKTHKMNWMRNPKLHVLNPFETTQNINAIYLERAGQTYIEPMLTSCIKSAVPTAPSALTSRASRQLQAP